MCLGPGLIVWYDLNNGKETDLVLRMLGASRGQVRLQLQQGNYQDSTCIAAKYIWSFVYCVIILCVFLLPNVYFLLCVCIAVLRTLVVG
jgi:hypothetical protein